MRRMETDKREQGLTMRMATEALQIRHEEMPAAVRGVARDCLADWLGCTFAGLQEPTAAIVTRAVLEEGGAPQSTLVGRGIKASMAQAALANGTASHALDYDDVNLALPGHPSVAILPALLALAEHRDAPGDAVVAAFAAGYETACRLGVLLAPDHYANGFHATATIGTLGAAMACAHLLQLSPTQAAHALGVAATQAAGLKSMFGSMAKPLHAGQAAQAGVRAALLASKGFESRIDALECEGGFGRAHGAAFHVEEALSTPAGGWHLLHSIFKIHAACFSTHSTIEAVLALRNEHGLAADDVVQVHVSAGQACAICNIQQPFTGLEAKFSLRAAAALALLGIDTSSLQAWDGVREEHVRRVLERVHVELGPGQGLSESTVTLQRADGRTLTRHLDVGAALADKGEQARRVDAKFRAIAAPVIGRERCDRILDRLGSFGRGTGCATLMREMN